MTEPDAVSTVESPAWVQAIEALGPATPSPARERLARHWLREAELERASVGSFARNGMQLLALGAPLELLAGVHLAALDQTRHARVSYTVASAYAGERFGPGPLSVAELGLEGVNAADMAAETLVEGCCNETVASLVARRGSEDAVEPAIKAALAAVAVDEEKHAELAWKSLAWLLRAFADQTRTAITSAADELRRELASHTDGDRESDDEGGDDGVGLARHGVVSRTNRAETRRQAIAHVVLPCVESMLAAIAVP